MRRSAQSNSIEQKLQSATDHINDRWWQLPYPLTKIRFVHRHDLRHVHHARLRQMGVALS